MAKDDQRTAGGPRALAQSLARVTKPTLAKRGFAEVGILADWPAIVGPQLAEHVCPMRVAYPPNERADGTLHLRVASGSLALQLKHLEPLVIERVNSYFGYHAVARLAIAQGPLPRRRRHLPPPPPDTDESRLAGTMAKVEDEDLKRALEGLGRYVVKR